MTQAVTLSGLGSTNALYTDSSGNVGIGTASPAHKLDIVSSANSTIGTRVYNTNAGSAAYTGLILGNDTNSNTQGLFLNSSTNASYAGANSLSLIQVGAYPIGFATNNTERMRIDASGRVTTPNQPFFSARPTTDYSAGSMPAGIIAMTAQINNGNCFSAATSRFTAPVSGFYRTTYGGLQLTSTVTSLMINGVRDNYPQGVHYNGVSYSTVTITVIKQLAAGDYLQIEGWNGGGYHSPWYTWSVELIG